MSFPWSGLTLSIPRLDPFFVFCRKVQTLAWYITSYNQIPSCLSSFTSSAFFKAYSQSVLLLLIIFSSSASWILKWCSVSHVDLVFDIHYSLLFLKKFIYLFMAVSGLRFCAKAFSSCGKWGPLFIAVHGPLTIAASLVAEHRLQMRRLSNCGSRA